MKFAMLSDTHYISRRMIADDKDAELMLQPAVSEQAVLSAAADNDTLFIIGDLTDSGDRYSHEDFASFLRSVKAGGKKIYVIFATHDYHHHKAYVRRYGEKQSFASQPWNSPYFDIGGLEKKEDEPCLVEALGPEEIWEIYKEFGPDEAYSVYAPSFSYCLDLDEKTRCLMLNDIFRNEEALKDKSPTYTPGCLRWIKRMADEAKRDGKFIFACSHHPMLPAAPAHRIGAGKQNRDMRSPVVGHMLADMGIELIFTGHSHFCDVGWLKSDRGSLLCDITTPSVRFYPPAYRNIELDGLSRSVKYDCNYVPVPENCEIAEKDLLSHYHDAFYNKYYKSITGSNAFAKKFFDKVTVGDIYFLVKGMAGLTKKEIRSVENIKLFDFIIEIAFNMLTGDGKFTPDTPEYRIMMPLCAKLDSIIDTQPFIDVKNKFLSGYSVSEVIEPMLFNNGTPDRECTLRFTQAPEKKFSAPVYVSHAGDVLMAFITVLAVSLSGFAPVLTAVGIPALTIRKKMKLKKAPDGKKDIY